MTHRVDVIVVAPRWLFIWGSAISSNCWFHVGGYAFSKRTLQKIVCEMLAFDTNSINRSCHSPCWCWQLQSKFEKHEIKTCLSNVWWTSAVRPAGQTGFLDWFIQQATLNMHWTVRTCTRNLGASKRCVHVEMIAIHLIDYWTRSEDVL